MAAPHLLKQNYIFTSALGESFAHWNLKSTGTSDPSLPVTLTILTCPQYLPELLRWWSPCPLAFSTWHPDRTVHLLHCGHMLNFHSVSWAWQAGSSEIWLGPQLWPWLSSLLVWPQLHGPACPMLILAFVPCSCKLSENALPVHPAHPLRCSWGLSYPRKPSMASPQLITWTRKTHIPSKLG